MTRAESIAIATIGAIAAPAAILLGSAILGVFKKLSYGNYDGGSMLIVACALVAMGGVFIITQRMKFVTFYAVLSSLTLLIVLLAYYLWDYEKRNDEFETDLLFMLFAIVPYLIVLLIGLFKRWYRTPAGAA